MNGFNGNDREFKCILLQSGMPGGVLADYRPNHLVHPEPLPSYSSDVKFNISDINSVVLVHVLIHLEGESRMISPSVCCFSFHYPVTEWGKDKTCKC